LGNKKDRFILIKFEEDQIQYLVSEIKNNNKEAFRDFFFCFQPKVFRFLYRYTSIKEIAEDLTQETFIKFWEVKENLDISSSPVSYLFRIATNLANNYVSRKPALQPIYEKDELLVNICKDPDKELDQVILMDDFQKAINTLPERCRAIFILSRFDGYEYSEISDTLKISLQTVKNQMNKAISILRKQLAAHLD
jgi:RNA polymerase sigma-70 factor (ECF subfamily)